MPLLAKIRQALQSIGHASKPTTRALIGDVNWRAPPWLKWTATRARTGIRATIAHARRHPRRTALVATAVLAVFGGAYATWYWYEHRPRPVETTFNVSAPKLTCYACEPVGKPDPLVIHFADSAATLATSGKDLDPKSAVIAMKPALKGVWHWDDDRVLRFQPSEDWPIATEFKVTLAQHGLVADHVHLKEYNFTFNTPEFQAKLGSTEFHQDPVVASDKKVVVTVTFTHPVDPERFEKLVSLTLFEKVTNELEKDRGKTPFTVIYDKQRLNAYIHSGQLSVPEKLGRLAIRIERGIRAARGGNETNSPLLANVSVPGLHSLEVASVGLEIARNERAEPSQVLIVSMTHSVLEHDMPKSVHAWRLPARHPNAALQARFEINNHGKPYPWSEVSVDSDILKASSPLPLTQIPGELEHYELHSFHHEAEPGEFVYIKVEKGLRSFGGYILDRSFEGVYQVPQYPQELHIAQQGSLLALSGQKTLTVLTRGVAALRVEAGRLLPQQIQHLVAQTEGNFANPRFKNWNFDQAEITERLTDTISVPPGKAGAPHYTPIALAHYLEGKGAESRGGGGLEAHYLKGQGAEGRASTAAGAEPGRGVFFLKVMAWDTEHDRSLNGLQDNRLIVITDLGLLVKQSMDGSQDLFVQSIHSGDPVSDVKIEILGRNGLAVLNATTDAEGHAHFPDLKSFTREQQPVVYLAQRGQDSSFLSIERRDRGLDLSMFDVGGVDNRIDQGSLSAYLFCDRGLYRPGEEIRAGVIVRTQDWKHSVEGIPLRLQITDPRGVMVRDEKFTAGAAGFGEIKQATRTTAPAGTYTISMSIVKDHGTTELIGSTTVQVRDFLPDRLRLATHLSTEQRDGWVSPDNLKAHINLQNLFGTPAANRRVTAHMTLSPAFPSFSSYPGFEFYDPQSARQSFEETLTPATTDEKGEADFDLNLQRFARATYRLEIDTEGFEADGGRGVSSAAAQLVSNSPYLVGWKADGDLHYVSRDAKRSADFIAIDSHAQKTQVEHLKWVRIEIRYVSTLIRQSNGTYQYESRRKEVVTNEQETSLPKTITLDSTTPGYFAYVITDSTGQRLARMEYHVAGEANLTRTLEKDAQLQITLARNDYAAGEDIEMQIQAPYTGAGLITIERDHVYAWHWFHATTTTSTQKIKLPAASDKRPIEGNAYVHVAFVRDPDSDEIYTSPLSYGVQPFSINLDSRKTPIHLEIPALVKPGTPLKIGYSTPKQARIVVFAVDEGILQVAAYHTPDPLSHFFQKRALAVETTQILDLILPELRRGKLGAAPGGDQGSALSRHLNPFQRKGDKPVVYWSAIIDSDSTPRELEYNVPDYFNGNLRVMAVAVSNDAIGVAENHTTVRGDYVISPNAPTTVTPGDQFEVSVGVANNLAGSGPQAQVTVQLETTPHALLIVSEPTQTLAIAENREGIAHFKITALDQLGAADLTFTAASPTNATVARRKIDLSIRPATPYMTSLAAGHLKQGTKDVNLTRNLYPQFRTLEASTSRVPLSLAHGLVSYLSNYPYQCTEQIVSQALPALELGDRPEFGYVKQAPGANIDALIDELRTRQNDDGAYKLWPGGNTVVEFVSLYAQHFLLEAQAHGDPVPGSLVESGNAYLRKLAIRDGNSLEDERDSAYAIYLLVRQGHVMSAEALALRKRLTDRYQGEWQQDLAAAWLAASFKLMQQDRDAGQAIAKLAFNTNGGISLYNDDMTRDAFLLYILSKYFPERLGTLPPQAFENLADRINTNVFHSLSAGTTLLALNAYINATHADTDPELGISERIDNQVKALQLPAGLIPKVQYEANAKALRFENNEPLNAFYLVNQSGFDRTPPQAAISKGFEILREYTDDQGHLLTQVKMGERITVHLKLRATQGQVDAVALEDLLPGGFELVIPQEGEFYTGTAEFADPREDRVVFYTTLTTDVRELTYKIKATNIGTYVVPPAFGEAMYNRNLLARSIAGKIEVIKP